MVGVCCEFLELPGDVPFFLELRRPEQMFEASLAQIAKSDPLFLIDVVISEVDAAGSQFNCETERQRTVRPNFYPLGPIGTFPFPFLCPFPFETR
jgi:hypothetical protein